MNQVTENNAPIHTTYDPSSTYTYRNGQHQKSFNAAAQSSGEGDNSGSGNQNTSKSSAGVDHELEQDVLLQLGVFEPKESSLPFDATTLAALRKHFGGDDQKIYDYVISLVKPDLQQFNKDVLNYILLRAVGDQLGLGSTGTQTDEEILTDKVTAALTDYNPYSSLPLLSDKLIDELRNFFNNDEEAYDFIADIINANPNINKFGADIKDLLAEVSDQLGLGSTGTQTDEEILTDKVTAALTDYKPNSSSPLFDKSLIDDLIDFYGSPEEAYEIVEGIINNNPNINTSGVNKDDLVKEAYKLLHAGSTGTPTEEEILTDKVTKAFSDYDPNSRIPLFDNSLIDEILNFFDNSEGAYDFIDAIVKNNPNLNQIVDNNSLQEAANKLIEKKVLTDKVTTALSLYDSSNPLFDQDLLDELLAFAGGDAQIALNFIGSILNDPHLGLTADTKQKLLDAASKLLEAGNTGTLTKQELEDQVTSALKHYNHDKSPSLFGKDLLQNLLNFFNNDNEKAYEFVEDIINNSPPLNSTVSNNELKEEARKLLGVGNTGTLTKQELEDQVISELKHYNHDKSTSLFGTDLLQNLLNFFNNNNEKAYKFVEDIINNSPPLNSTVSNNELKEEARKLLGVDNTGMGVQPKPQR